MPRSVGAVVAPISRIALSTGGGDAPGLNAVIRAATLAARHRGWDVIGIRDGFNGLLAPPDHYPAGGTIALTTDAVRGIVHRGGTILGTTNRGNPFVYPVATADGPADYSELCLANTKKLNLDAVIVIGGDGTLAIAHELHLRGMPIVGVPKTIDNDIAETTMTFGFDTAVSFATDAIDRLHSTTITRWCASAVECSRSIASVANDTA